ncbi:anaerobic C4-dicarboxylate transporter family protein [Shigella flexneri]
MLFTIQLIIILICLFYGARKGWYRAGFIRRYRSGHSGLRLPPSARHQSTSCWLSLRWLAASATLQASAGLDVMLQIAEKLLRRNPKYVSIVAPVCDLYTDHSLRYGSCGLHHLPIIYDVAISTISS